MACQKLCHYTHYITHKNNRFFCYIRIKSIQLKIDEDFKNEIKNKHREMICNVMPKLSNQHHNEMKKQSAYNISILNKPHIVLLLNFVLQINIMYENENIKKYKVFFLKKKKNVL